MIRPEEFVPDLVRNRDSIRPWSEWLEGAVLFADVSGFTPMAEALSPLGAEGGEVLTRILNRYFARMIGIVRDHGGDVLKFAGDAILCFFPEPHSRSSVMRCARSMKQAIRAFQNIETPVRKFSLQFKIGIGRGEVLVAAVGDPNVRRDWVFGGPAVEQSADAEKKASAGSIISSRTNAFRKQRTRNPHHATPTSMDCRPYLIPQVHNMLIEGYEKYVGAHQDVVPVFLHFTGLWQDRNIFPVDLFHDFFSAVIAITESHQGHLNATMMDDKGPHLFLHFGAPNSIEKTANYACQWALEVRDMVATRFPDIRIRIGMTYGRVFTGIVGGSGRYNYTAVGDAVNLAARFMQLADEGDIVVNSSLLEAASAGFQFHSGGDRPIKGKERPQPIYFLSGVRESAAGASTAGPLVGREFEAAKIQASLQSARSGNPSMVVVEGEPGVGKTALIDHVRELARNDGWLILSGRSEITQHNHPYRPWRPIFQTLLFGKRDPDIHTIRKHAGLAQVFGSVSEIRHSEDPAEKRMLHHHLSLLLLKHVQRGPALLVLDDLHWFDSLSLDLLQDFLNHLRREPLLILAAARPVWAKEAFAERPNFCSLELKEMTREEVGLLAQQRLQGYARKSLVEHLFSRTHGNPFFVRQLLEYLEQQKMLIRIAGGWSLQKRHEQESLHGEEIIKAQVQQLPASERVHLLAAACMGPTFSEKVLQRTLQKRYRKESVASLCKGGFLQAHEDSWLSFSHSLLQETLYFTIPVAFRKMQHRRIGSAMESTFVRDRKRYFPNLANHFRLGAVRSKAIQYSLAAGDQLFGTLSFQEAANYYRHAFGLLSRTSDQRKWHAALRLAENLIHIGKIQESLAISRRLRMRCRKPDVYQKACMLQLDAMRRLSNYRYLPFALRLLSRKKGVKNSAVCRLLHLIGSTYFWRGQAAEASKYLLPASLYSPEKGHNEAILSSNIFLANIEADRGKFQNARKQIQRALKLVRESGRKDLEIRIRYEWASILGDRGKPEQAKSILQDLLPLAESVGDFYRVAAILVSLGQAEFALGDESKAFEYFQEAVALFSSIAIPHGKAKAEMWLGILAFTGQQFQQAYDLYHRSTTVLESAGERLESAYGYYNLTEVCLKMGREDEARDWYAKGLRCFEARQNPSLAKLYSDLDTQLPGRAPV